MSWAGREACQCLRVTASAPHSSLFGSTLSNEGEGRGLLAVMCIGVRGWEAKGGKEQWKGGKRGWDSVMCGGETS